MAITRRNPTGAVELYGVAADVKPTTFGVGSIFFETDTGVVYRWSGSAWFAVSATSSGTTQVGGGVASGDPDSGNPVKVGGVYNTTPPTLANGERGDLQLDGNANLKTVEGAVEYPTWVDIPGNDVDVSAKATPGYLRAAIATNANAAIRYFQVHNKATAPAGGDVPVLSIPMAASNAQPLFLGEAHFGRGGKPFSIGIAGGISTTYATFTAATPADHFWSLGYN